MTKISFGSKKGGISKTFEYKAKPKALPIAQKALRIAKGNRTFAAEDFTLATTAMTASLVPTVRYIQPPGDAGPGQKQTIQDLEFSILLKVDVASAVVNSWRCDLVLDRTPSKVTLSLADMYGIATPKITALLNYDAIERYKIVKSYSGSFYVDSSVSRHIHFKVRSGLVCEAEGPVFDNNLVLKNAYYFVFWTDATANTPTISYSSRLTSIVT